MHTANKKKNLRPYLFDLKTVLNSALKCLITCGNDPQIVDPFQQKFFWTKFCTKCSPFKRTSLSSAPGIKNTIRQTYEQITRGHCHHL
jgi:hypothetical protein